MKLLRRILPGLILVVMLAWLCGGSVIFPDEPIEKCDSNVDYLYKDHRDGYCGKQGQSHTEVDFRNYNIWHTSLFVIWPLGMLFLAYLGRKRA